MLACQAELMHDSLMNCLRVNLVVVLISVLLFASCSDRKEDHAAQKSDQEISKEFPLRNSSSPASLTRLADIIKAIDALYASGQGSQDAVEGLLVEAVDLSPSEIADWVASLPSGTKKEESIKIIFKRWAQKTPDKAVGHISANFQGLDYRAALLSAIEGTAITAPEVALSLIPDTTGDALRPSLIDAFISAAIVQHPVFVADWVSSLPDGSERGQVIDSLLDHWSKKQPAAAAKWLLSNLSVDEQSAHSKVLLSNLASITSQDVLASAQANNASSSGKSEIGITEKIYLKSGESQQNINAGLGSVFYIQKPNILILWGSGVGQFDISFINRGVLSTKTPNIDMLAERGATFTDWYGQQSIAAAEVAFLTGQAPIKAGLARSKAPDSGQVSNNEYLTIARIIKDLGYNTGYFGYSEIGGREDILPTNQGFDEFFGNLHPLEEGVSFSEADQKATTFLPPLYKGLVHSFSDGQVALAGTINKERIAKLDSEVTSKAIAFIQSSKKQGKPFFVWWKSSSMQGPVSGGSQLDEGKSPFDTQARRALVEHDLRVGDLLLQLNELGLDQTTIVIYSADTGPKAFAWPEGGLTMFRGDKGTQWEGAYRVPAFIRWPGVIKPGSIINEIVSHEDMLPTLLAAAGAPGIKEELLQGRSVDGGFFTNQLDGYNLFPALRGETSWPRREFFYWTEYGSLGALRFENYKATFLEQSTSGFKARFQPLNALQTPLLTDLRKDPFELAADLGIGYPNWYFENRAKIEGALPFLESCIKSFKRFPPKEPRALFHLESAIDMIRSSAVE